jgi:hypothetical protein
MIAVVSVVVALLCFRVARRTKLISEWGLTDDLGGYPKSYVEDSNELAHEFTFEFQSVIAQLDGIEALKCADMAEML